ncbi:hypothetical protein CYMTET_3051 [Cymbomonas tetramitiformis]|uniref:Secreted protein n=1 Tax=Cymbomonas tetramitiformis TaxID=36881 RepID=A0AAE0LLH2_9CHLO|nr:hypothetical protein CYMTET_3051 [Cymbomonas tetramitiformis]
MCHPQRHTHALCILNRCSLLFMLLACLLNTVCSGRAVGFGGRSTHTHSTPSVSRQSGVARLGSQISALRSQRPQSSSQASRSTAHYRRQERIAPQTYTEHETLPVRPKEVSRSSVNKARILPAPEPQRSYRLHENRPRRNPAAGTRVATSHAATRAGVIGAAALTRSTMTHGRANMPVNSQTPSKQSPSTFSFETMPSNKTLHVIIKNDSGENAANFAEKDEGGLNTSDVSVEQQTSKDDRKAEEVGRKHIFADSSGDEQARAHTDSAVE